MRTGLAEEAAPYAVFAAAFAALACGAYPWLAPRDAGDLALSALTLFPAHPPGYPLYALSGRAWLALLPLGNPAYALNLMSAAATAAGAAVLFAWARARVGAGTAAALAAAFALSGPARKFSGLSEMYAAQALFLAVLIKLSDVGPGGAARRAAAAGLAAGLGLVNHPTLLFALPGLALLYRMSARRWALAAAFCALGLALELFLAVRLGSLSEGLRAALRSEYGTFELFSGLSAPLTPSGAAALAGHWLAEAAVPPVLLLAALAWRGARREAAALWLSAVLAGPFFFLLSRFDVSGWVARSVLESAFVSASLLLTALAVLGLSRVAPGARFWAAALAAAWAAWSGDVAGSHRDDFSARDYVQSVRRLVPPGASVLAAGDTALFGLRFAETGGGSPRRVLSTFDAAEAPDYVLGLNAEALQARGLKVEPEGLVQRRGRALLGERAWELTALRPSRALEEGESYAHDVRLSYAFAHYLSGDLLDRAKRPTGEHAEWAAALDPEDFSLR